MSFHLSRLLAHLRPEALRLYLEDRFPALSDDIDWTAEPKELRSAVAAAIDRMASKREDLLAALERVDLLGDEAGDRAIVAVLDVDAAASGQFAKAGNAKERALWLLGANPNGFERAEEIRYADHYSGGGRQWTGFLGPRNRWPSLEGGRLHRFHQTVEAAFRAYDGSGSSIHLMPFKRGPTKPERHGSGSVFQLAIYLEGLPATSTEFVEGQLVRRGMRPALEMALTYAPETGEIDVVGKGGNKLRAAVAKAFAEELFEADAALEPVRLRQLDLSALTANPRFPTEPEDGIEIVRLLMVRLGIDAGPGRVTLETHAKSSRTLHEISRAWFPQDDPLRRRPSITKAKLAVQFHPRPGQRRGRSLPVELTVPYGCNLRDRSEQERLIGEKYLRKWGLVRDIS